MLSFYIYATVFIRTTVLHVIHSVEYTVFLSFYRQQKGMTHSSYATYCISSLSAISLTIVCSFPPFLFSFSSTVGKGVAYGFIGLCRTRLRTQQR
jgi:hypothetical protein